MKYYWIASTIEMKTDALPSHEINTKIVIFADFKSFALIFKVILLIIFIYFSTPFIDYSYKIFMSSKSGP